MRRFERERQVSALNVQPSRVHNIQPEQLIPDAQFKRKTSLGDVEEFTIINGPYSDLESRKIMVTAFSAIRQLHSRYLVDLGVLPYETGSWNHSMLEKIGE